MDYIKEYNALLENCLDNMYDKGALLVFCDFLDDYQDRDEFKDLEFAERSKFLRGYCNCFYGYEGMTSFHIQQDKSGNIFGSIQLYHDINILFDFFIIKSVQASTRGYEIYEKYSKIMRVQCLQI